MFDRPVCRYLSFCLAALIGASCAVALGDPKPSAGSAAPAPTDLPMGDVAAHANIVRGDEITDAQKDAVEKGLAWLAHNQASNGEYSHGMSSAGITGLAGLAFMSAGNLPGRGKYGENVARALKFVLDNCQESGLITADQMHGAMYGHGFATLFLSEVYGMTGDPAIKEKLQNAVRLIERTQNREGGWRYQPAPLDADISVTICQVMALRGARDAGIKVQNETIDNAIKYVRACQNPDGGFSYQAHQNSGSGFARSAAGVASLYYAGVFDGNDLKRGLKYLAKYTPRPGNMQTADAEGHYFYGNYYAVQAMFLAGGDYWAAWYPAVRDQLIKRRQNDHWSGDQSEDFATALALIILQMPNRYLPVFNGKGPGG
jgi:hypothetical protein